MKTMTTFKIEYQLPWNWHTVNAPLLKRCLQVFFRDIIPTLVILALVGWGAQVMAEKIHQAKLSGSTVIADVVAEQLNGAGLSLPGQESRGQAEAD